MVSLRISGSWKACCWSFSAFRERGNEKSNKADCLEEIPQFFVLVPILFSVPGLDGQHEVTIVTPVQKEEDDVEAHASDPESYLSLSIFSCLCCCPILGLSAIFFSGKTFSLCCILGDTFICSMAKRRQGLQEPRPTWSPELFSTLRSFHAAKRGIVG